MEKTSMIFANASVSSSTSLSSLSITSWPLSAQSENSFHLSSQPRLWADRLATIVPRAAARAPMYADTEPPPGAADSEAVSRANPFTLILTRRSLRAWTSSSIIRYSITFSFGLNGFKSLRPNDLTAILISSSSGTPRERCCFAK